jgi:hypothetical protein
MVHSPLAVRHGRWIVCRSPRAVGAGSFAVRRAQMRDATGQAAKV